MTDFLFIHPVDVLYLRGNRLFGGSGDHSQALMPPWPSIAAGALRTRMLADINFNFHDYKKGEKPPEPSGSCLGTPDMPGSFRISHFTLAKKTGQNVEAFFRLPADIVVHQKQDKTIFHYLKPDSIGNGILSSHPTSKMPILRANEQFKPKTNFWLNKEGLRAYLKGEGIIDSHYEKTENLWSGDLRLGIAMTPESRTADEGRIYTSETVALKDKVGFLVGVEGARGVLPLSGLLRLGGDGRGTDIKQCYPDLPEPPWNEIEKSARFRMILTTPGLFSDGWLPPGVETDGMSWRWSYGNCRARLVSACVGKAEVVSGWNLAAEKPKTALKATPAGSVYWFNEFEGDIKILKLILVDGLWSNNRSIDAQRRAEGFNNVIFGVW
jgi:CRISPR-associated protein Cmr3